jgi:hypothetical protein
VDVAARFDGDKILQMVAYMLLDCAVDTKMRSDLGIDFVPRTPGLFREIFVKLFAITAPGVSLAYSLMLQKSANSCRRPLRWLKDLTRGRSTITRAISSRMAFLHRLRTTNAKSSRDLQDRRGEIASNEGAQFVC